MSTPKEVDQLFDLNPSLPFSGNELRDTNTEGRMRRQGRGSRIEGRSDVKEGDRTYRQRHDCRRLRRRRGSNHHGRSPSWAIGRRELRVS